MLKLVNIIKDYKVGGGNVINALRGVSMEFRQSEFISVLGPSGCGKTTLLNIIGGLDHATSGDLLIYNKSTKKYKDRDWDVYRNHRIGFVFQSYNLIPHQTVLGNVELSLTIAGLSKAERVERAKKALDKVGLSDQYNKKPNQLSGGQSQRVAIARALVNDPEILLADEPTGALDTVTSKQIMELVKEISKERLVIMVTHNGEIAEKYSTRIIRLLDGNLLSDTNPYNEADARREAAILDKKEKEIQAEYDAIKAAIIEREDLKKKPKIESTAADKKIKKSVNENEKTAAKKLAAEKKAAAKKIAEDKKVAAKKLAEEKRINKKIAGIINNNKKENSEKLSYEDIKAAVLQEEAENKLKQQALETEKKDKEIHKKAQNELDKRHKKERAKMSFFTAFKLSLKNLFSKKARTIMTSIAGSIGIIGVSLVLAISSGITNFINDMQNDMLSGNPIVIAKSGFDINSLMDSMNTQEKIEFIKANGYANIDSMMETLAKRAETMQDMFIQNNIKKNYVDFVQDIPKEWLSALFLNYGLDVSNSIYTNFKESATKEYNVSLSGIKAIYSSVLKETEYKEYAPMIDSLSQSFRQAPEAEDYMKSQYTLEYGEYAKKQNEIMIVLGNDRVLNDLLLAQLGYYAQEEFLNLVYKATGDKLYNASIDRFYNAEKEIYEISYEELIGRKFTWYKNDDIFTPNFSEPGKINPNNPFTYNAYDTRNDGLELEVVGILEPNENLSFGSLSAGFYYTTAFAEEIVKQNRNSELAVFLRDNDESEFKSAIMFYPAGTELPLPGKPVTPIDITIPSGITFEYWYSYDKKDNEQAIGVVGSTDQMSSIINLIGSYFGGGSSSNVLASAAFSLQQLGGNIEDLGGGDYFALPNRIAIYPLDLDHKALVLEYLDKWNSDEPIPINGVPVAPGDRENITYSDPLSLIMSMIRQMVEIITIALVGFTSLSLVVSCVMIGIITYVSVVERTKEIGVIRSLGGRKRDVSNLFIAETGIIGLISGVFGIIVTYLLSGIVNLIVIRFTDIGNVSIAALPWWMAAIMIGISVGLTLLSGVFPARAAAKKDPVVALRTE